MSTPIAHHLKAGALGSGSILRTGFVLLVAALATAACSTSEIVTSQLQPFQACSAADLQHDHSASCNGGRNVLMAMASGQAVAPHEVVEEEVLDEQRGGYISVGGLQVDFGFEFRSMVNGVPQLVSVMTLDDMVGSGFVPNLNTVTITGVDGSGTEIIHAAGPNGINATILNSQNGIEITNISTLAIDIIGLGNVRQGGRGLGNGRRMPMELQQAIIRSLVK